MTNEKDIGLTVFALQGENVKRVRAVRIEPPRTGVVKIAGKNGAGKSSTLDLIVFALGGGRGLPAMPIRKGATAASDTVVLQNAEGEPVLKVERKWTGKDSYLKVERIGGAAIRSPQEFLDALVGEGLAFDPLAFMRLRPREQVDQLLAALGLMAPLTELDAEATQVHEARRLTNRDAATLKANLATTPAAPEGTPDEEVSVAALMLEREALEAQRLEAAQADQVAGQAVAALALCDAEAMRAREAVEVAQRRLDAAIKAKIAAESAVTIAQSRAAKCPRPDLGDVTRQINAADEVNKAVRAKARRHQLAGDILKAETAARDATARLDSLNEQKRLLLEGAQFPVPGLGFELVGGTYTVTLGGVPLAQAGQSEAIVVGLGLAMALAPAVRVIIVRDGSLLDAETLARVDALAQERGYQIFTEIVGPDGDDAFVIEDGGVLKAPERSPR